MCGRLRVSIYCVLMIALAGAAPAALASECQGATNPVPPDGSTVGRDLWACKTYCGGIFLDYTPCADAVSHTAYFSDNEQDVINRNPDRCLGNPPWPEVSETMFVVDYDDGDGPIPEYVRPPLIRCTTYYWCVDTFDGEQNIPGPIWSFTLIDEKAWGPYPPDGDDCVPTIATMTWNLGDLDTTARTLSYYVYIGADEAAVAAVTTGDTATPLYMGNVSTESYEYDNLEPEAEYFWRVDTKLSLTRPPFTPTYYAGNVWNFSTGFPFGGILREWWTGIPGRTIIDLVGVDPNYPDNPAGREILSNFEGPVDWGDDYGSRLHGWLRIKQTGEYTFYIAADESGELWLSTDSNPANANLVAHVISGVWPRSWDMYPHQASEPIFLEAGKRYYISALHKEEGGPDNVAVAWQGPDTGGARQIISGMHLIPYAPVFARNPYPADRSACFLFDVTLAWEAGIDESTDSPYATQHVYVGDDPEAVAVATTASPEYMGSPTGPNEYGPLSLSGEGYVYWRVDGVSAETGTVRYPGSVWRFESACCMCPHLDAALRLWLRFENNVLDSSGNGNDGIEIGGPTYVAGADGQAIHLDGIDDYVDVEYAIGISGDQPRTIAAWIKADTNAVPDWTNVFGFAGPGGEGTQFDIEVVGDTNSATAGHYGLNLNGQAYDIIPVDLEWHHLAATFNGTAARLYADAVLVDTIIPVVTIDTSDNIRVGKRYDNDNYFPGSIDDARIYDTPIDEVHIAEILMIDSRLPWPSSPNPWNRAGDIPPGQVALSWEPGACAADVNGSIVYYSDDPTTVAKRTAPSTAVSGSSFTLPMSLDFDETFYWAVDAVNGPCIWPGDTWNFTTVNWLSVDDMEPYEPWTDPSGPWIFVVWEDMAGDCKPGSGNGTGSWVTENDDPVFVLGGLQSMKYEFDNDGLVFNPCDLTMVIRGYPYYSRIEAQTADLPSGIGSGWTVDGVRALQINFMGQTGNATTEPLWVQLQDSKKGYGNKVFYGDYPGESLNDINDPNWHEWNIDLADFAIDLNDVVSITIGIGNEDANTPGGSGTLYFDDIRLYTPRCIPNRRTPAFAKLDYAPEDNPDCTIDCRELAIMAQNWLQTAEPIDAPPNIINAEGEDTPTINFKDYAELIKTWLQTQTWPF